MWTTLENKFYLFKKISFNFLLYCMCSAEMYFKCLYVSSALILGEYAHFQDRGIQLVSVSNLFLQQVTSCVSEYFHLILSLLITILCSNYHIRIRLLYWCYVTNSNTHEVPSIDIFYPPWLGVCISASYNFTWKWKAGFDVQLLPSVGCELDLHLLTYFDLLWNWELY